MKRISERNTRGLPRGKRANSNRHSLPFEDSSRNAAGSFKIALASDHGGYTLKQSLLEFLNHKPGLIVEDLGCYSEDSVDYPDYAQMVAQKISHGEADRGILICGTGMGMAIAANKIKGVRAAAVTDLFSARMTREHNNINVLCLGGRITGVGVAQEIVNLFLETPFEGGRHAKRVKKIDSLDRG